jgi:GTPase SAR1 family protein
MFYNGQKYMLEVIDTVSSQDELNNPKWMKEANAILLVCSLTSKKSLKGLGYYINMRKRLEIDAPIILVASKLDKVGERKLTKEELQEFAIKNNIDHVFETSAASNENVTQTFIVLARHAFYNYNFANIWKKIAKGESVRDTKIDHKNKCILS